MNLPVALRASTPSLRLFDIMLRNDMLHLVLSMTQVKYILYVNFRT